MTTLAERSKIESDSLTVAQIIGASDANILSAIGDLVPAFAIGRDVRRPV